MTGQIKLKGIPGNFTEADFMATNFSTAEEKAKIANKLTRFILGGFKQNSFSKTMYTRLSNMFGHIAHYNIHGFYETWFAGAKERREWAQYVLRGGAYGCVGSPVHTWSDVEKASMNWMQENRILEQLDAQYRAEVEECEPALLRNLQAKYPAQAGEASAIPVQLEGTANTLDVRSQQLALF